ncbi:clan AA aspartic protease [Hartmannibacter diazotrophicus]|uniref:Clan AA aspartic protease n=1 Tax=Hartmannibacter diazotrophicus TaxID=1482074 RepID=A0A2C9D1L6_9HYPH|nr:TIGR02281 family clan AA aspartic protease [Hartmannibacter diazotrophicus]SON54212.1 clan AA aspartic protease [Hartmannibacter diazotrophicus]
MARLVFAVLCLLTVVAWMVPDLEQLGARDDLAVVATATVASPDDAALPRLGGHEVLVPSDPRGHFVMSMMLNSTPTRMLADTGATVVALRESDARRVGIFVGRNDYRQPINTANGQAFGAPVRIASMRIDAIELNDVEAIVMPDESLQTNLLGMSFLSRLERFEISGGQLVLAD